MKEKIINILGAVSNLGLATCCFLCELNKTQLCLIGCIFILEAIECIDKLKK